MKKKVSYPIFQKEMILRDFKRKKKNVIYYARIVIEHFIILIESTIFHMKISFYSQFKSDIYDQNLGVGGAIPSRSTKS